MKILFLSDVYFPRVNGVSTSIETFRDEFRKLGHTVHLIAPDYCAKSGDEDGIMRVPARILPFDPEDRLMKFRWIMCQLERLRDERYDLIHIQTPFVAHYLGLKLSRLLHIPCVETYHTFFEEYLHHYLPFLPKKLTCMAARRFSRHQGNSVDGMIVPSHPMMEVLRNYGVTTLAEIIPTGLKAASFIPGNRAHFRDRYGIADKRPVLLFVGRVAHEKNIGFLLQIVERVRQNIPDVLLLIAGEGPALKGLRQEVEKSGLTDNVMFIGYLERHTQLNDCYSAADIFVFSSRTETQGLVLLEAMAQGIPLVSTAEMGTRDVLREEQGVWISQEKVDEFSGKVIKMLHDAEARIRLAAAGRQYAQSWSSARLAERMLAFYQTVQQQNKQGRD